MAQRDPLVEYQREGFDMFNAMMDGIKEESAGALFNLQVEVQQNPITEEATDASAVPGAQPGLAPAGPGTRAGPGTPAGAVGPAGAAPQAGAAPAVGAGAGASAGAATGAGASRTGNRRRNKAATASGGATAGARGASGTAKGSGTAGRTATGSGGSGRSGGRHRSGPAPEAADGNGASPVLPPGLTPRRTGALQYTAPSVDGGTHVESHIEGAPTGDFAHAGRNDPCPCGSGRKYKRCHGDPRNRATS
jgi:preprotein translocase subunit SecA